jgi:phosphoribosyl-dephospho-CoA transferase
MTQSSADPVGWGTVAAPARHALLRVAPEAYATALAGRPDLRRDPLLADWAGRGRPLIARRSGCCDPPGCVAAGIPLPPSHGKRRIAVALPPGAVVSVEPPMRLIAAARFAPAAWRPAIDALLNLGQRLGLDARVFGGLAWTALTGLDYMSETSDLDLLFPLDWGTGAPGCLDKLLDELLDGLARIDRSAPIRLDGEILWLRAGMAANWREVLAGAGEVLVKTSEGVALWPLRQFLDAGATGAGNRRAAA